VATYDGVLLDQGGAALNVMSSAFGATGNGTTDDSGAIQSAINALPGSGGIVYLPPGTYRIDTYLSLAPGVRLIGAGAGTTVLRLNSASQIGILCSETSLTTGLIQIADLAIDANGVEDTAEAIFLENLTLVEILRCQFRNFLTDAPIVKFVNVEGGVIRECVFFDVPATGVSLDPNELDPPSTSNSCRIYDSTFTMASGGSGVYIAPGTQNTAMTSKVALAITGRTGTSGCGAAALRQPCWSVTTSSFGMAHA